MSGKTKLDLYTKLAESEEIIAELLNLVDDFCKSNNMGKLVLQNYARLNDAPRNARAFLDKI